MTISSTQRTVTYTGNGTNQNFAIPFKLFATTDAVVTRLDTVTQVESTLVVGTDYSVTLNGDQNYSPGGSITTTVAPTATQRISITSAVPLTQPLDISNQGGFYPDVLNDALDRATIQIQQLQFSSSRLVQAPATDVAGNLTLPSSTARANRYLMFDASGNPVASTGTVTPTSSSAADITVQCNSANGSPTSNVIFSSFTNELARIGGASANMGIGTASPSARLHVAGTAQVDGTVTLGSTNAHAVIVRDGSAAAPAIARNGDTDTGIWFPGPNQVSVSTGGVQRLGLTDTLATLATSLSMSSQRIQSVGTPTAATDAMRIDDIVARWRIGVVHFSGIGPVQNICGSFSFTVSAFTSNGFTIAAPASGTGSGNWHWFTLTFTTSQFRWNSATSGGTAAPSFTFTNGAGALGSALVLALRAGA